MATGEEPMSRQWYVLRTRPRCEGSAAGALDREGLELFFPQVRTPRNSGGYTSTPLFPGYLFLRLDWESGGSPPVRHIPGVLDWVRFNGVVPAVPDDVISALISRVESLNDDGGLWTKFRRGDRVLVISGKMESLAEVLDEPETPDARVRVLLDFMRRQVPAQVPWRSLRPVPENSGLYHDRPARRTRGGGRWIRGQGPRAFATT